MRHLIYTILIGRILVCHCLAEIPQDWQRSIMSERSSSSNPHDVDLAQVVQRETLVGGLIVNNKSMEEGIPGSVMIIEGHQSADGSFWPAAQLEVQKAKGEQWTRVGSSGNEVPLSEVKIYSGTTVIGLRINLEAFKAYIGKYKLGRILLKSGDKAEFALDDLKAPDVKSGK